METAYQKIDLTKTGFGVFISSPSKTADIEQVLLFGAHCPLKHTVLLYALMDNSFSVQLSTIYAAFTFFLFEILIAVTIPINTTDRSINNVIPEVLLEAGEETKSSTS